jgi:hypothetical protein
MAIHVAIVAVGHVTPTGNVVSKNDPETTLRTMLSASQELRVLEDPDIPNTAGRPDVKTYLELEDGSGYILNHMDQTYIVTYIP